jgi:hypothetical protein
MQVGVSIGAIWVSTVRPARVLNGSQFECSAFSRITCSVNAHLELMNGRLGNFKNSMPPVDGYEAAPEAVARSDETGDASIMFGDLSIALSGQTGRTKELRHTQGSVEESDREIICTYCAIAETTGRRATGSLEIVGGSARGNLQMSRRLSRTSADRDKMIIKTCLLHIYCTIGFDGCLSIKQNT